MQKWLGAEGGGWDKVFENQDVNGNPGPPNAPLEHDEDCPMARCCTSEWESKQLFCDVESTTNSDDEPLDNSASATLKPSYFHTTTRRRLLNHFD